MVISTAKEKKQSLGENKEGRGIGPKERGLMSADHPIRLQTLYFLAVLPEADLEKKCSKDFDG